MKAKHEDTERPIAVITGASSGIGERFARRLAHTHDLILVARRGDRLESLSRELYGIGGCRCEPWIADLEREAEVAALAVRLESDPRITLLVNNAGFGVSGTYWEAAVEPVERMHRLHILATVRLCHSALRAFVPRDRGAIINVASVAAFIRGPGSGAYASTKSWMTAFTEGLHLDLKRARSSVQVQALCPGFTYTEFHDVMGVERYERAPKAYWLDADHVVDDSLRGLARGKLFVVPGWRYQILTAVVPRLPGPLRIAFEGLRRR